MKKWFIILFSVILSACSDEQKGIEENNNSIAEKAKKEKIIENSLEDYVHTPRFKIAEILKLLQLNPSKFESHVMRKGYVFDLTENEDSYTKYEFAYPNVSEFEYVVRYFDFVQGFQAPCDISWVTFNEIDYLEIKKEIEILGFKHATSQKYDDAMFSSYILNNSVIALKTRSHSGDVQSFDISIRNLTDTGIVESLTEKSIE